MKIKTMKEIGEEYYKFKIDEELLIYKYLCKTKFHKKKLKKLQPDVKFDTYYEWGKYVKNKYKNLLIGKLMEFSKFLNLQKRNEKPIFEMLSWLMPVFLSVYINVCIDVIYKSDNSLFANIFITIIIFVLFLLIIKEIIKPLLDEYSRENFFNDYKEIIDDMINECIKVKH